MTYNELLSVVERVIYSVAGFAAEAGIPIKTGNLRQSVDIREMPYGYDVFIDMGSGDENDKEHAWGVAPYADKVNQGNPYWRRLAFTIRDRLNYELSGAHQTEYNTRMPSEDENEVNE